MVAFPWALDAVVDAAVAVVDVLGATTLETQMKNRLLGSHHLLVLQSSGGKLSCLTMVMTALVMTAEVTPPMDPNLGITEKNGQKKKKHSNRAIMKLTGEGLNPSLGKVRAKTANL